MPCSRASSAASPAGVRWSRPTPPTRATSVTATTSAPAPRSAVGTPALPKSVPAGEIERFVIDQLRGIGTDPTLVRETLTHACARVQEDRTEPRGRTRGLRSGTAGRWNGEVCGLLGEVAKGSNPTALQRLAELQERIRTVEQGASEIHGQLLALDQELVTEDEVRTALSAFDPVWNALAPREQARIVQLLVERVDYDGANGTIAITFHAAGLKALAVERTTNGQSA